MPMALSIVQLHSLGQDNQNELLAFGHVMPLAPWSVSCVCMYVCFMNL